MNLKGINFKQPKYILPAILYLPLLGLGWLVIDIFHTEKAEVPTDMQTTEYLNPTLPEAKLRDDGIGNKYDNMAKSWGKIQDYSAVESIDQNEQEQKEDYNTKYTEEDLEWLGENEAARQAEQEHLRRMQESLQRSAAQGQAMQGDEEPSPLTEEERLMAANQRQQEALDELNKALAEARLKGQQATVEAREGIEDTATQIALTGTIEEKTENPNAVTAPSEDAEAGKMVKKLRVSSDYFNTIAENEPEPNLIKAIIDENIKAVDGSRVRLRLLDDVEIDGTVVKKGSYIYATMSGFGQQRVKGAVTSMLVKDELIKVNLTLYDTDGLEGLYVPSSSFRETSKEIAGGAFGNSMTVNQGSYENSLSQWGMQSLQNAVSKTTDAISKAIRKNRAKLKYGTHVYLVNGQQSSRK